MTTQLEGTEKSDFADIIGCAIAQLIKNQDLQTLRLLVLYIEQAIGEGKNYTQALILAREVLADS